jgi:hypothetical protein
MVPEQRIFITFDEFFKSSSKTFFEKEGFRVETEVEIFNLPKRLDVLVVKNPTLSMPDDFTLLNYWNEYNLISFKSKPDSLEIYDIWDSIIYLYGFINRKKDAKLENTTMSLFVNNHPREFLKKYKNFCKELEKGVWELNLNFNKIYLIELHEIALDGLDRLFLGNFSVDSVFSKVLREIDNPNKNSTETKRIDIIKNVIYHRIAGFEKDPEIRRKYMATVYEADITDLVKPHLEKVKLEGKFEGNLESALKMREEGDSIEKIIRITGLSVESLRDHGIV